MKVIILAGGFGTRLAEETEVKPKPMVEIGGKPILWHIIKHYSYYGFKEFVIALGYKGEVIKKYFMDYATLSQNMSIDLASGETQIHEKHGDDWKIHLIDTGLESSTGGRIKRLAPWLRDETFMLTYGDGVSNVNLQELLAFHRTCGLLGTVTAVRPPARFGGLVLQENKVTDFTEKPQIGEGWINGGFMVFEPQILEYLPTDQTSLEIDALEKLAAEGNLAAYQHNEFWQCMDTIRDLKLLEKMWQTGNPPWKCWD